MVDTLGCLARSGLPCLRCPRYDRERMGYVRDGDSVSGNTEYSK